jgi:hypothetical protein
MARRNRFTTHGFRLVSIAGLLLYLSAGMVSALENKGADQMVLEGGTQGMVPFPHHRHQDALRDCNLCHAVFPQEKGSIEALKAQGLLKKKEVMNKLCTSCHRQKKRTGEKSGPVTCKECHVK